MKMHFIRSTQSARLRGMTLTELLVVLAILSLLATILLPTVVNKVEDARVVTAKQEVKALAQAEEQCASMHGFYVPFQVLDDLNPNVYGGRSVPSGVAADILSNEVDSNIFLIDPHRSINTQISSQYTLSDRTIPRVESMYQYWGGPFIEFHRYYSPNSNATDLRSNDVRQDYPLDPWGQPYRFYSPYGLIGSGTAAYATSNWSDGAFNGRLQQDGNSIYDRYTVVSFGPDNLSPGTFGANPDSRKDDIAYTFGGLFTESSFRAFY